MKKMILFACFIIFPLLIRAQANNNTVGFKGGEKAFRMFIHHHMRYPAVVVDNGDNGIFFTVVYIDKAGKIDSVNVLNGSQNKSLQDEIIKTIMQSDFLWTKTDQNRIVLVPIIFYFLDTNPKKNDNNLIQITPDIERVISQKFSAMKCFFLPPVSIGTSATKRY